MLQRYDNPREGRAFVSVKSQIAHMSILELSLLTSQTSDLYIRLKAWSLLDNGKLYILTWNKCALFNLNLYNCKL